jgi:hypothetical protein
MVLRFESEREGYIRRGYIDASGNRILHTFCEKTPAIEFPLCGYKFNYTRGQHGHASLPATILPDVCEGGLEYYFLRGIRVPKAFIDATPEELDVNWLPANVDYRALYIEKLGVHRLTETTKPIDSAANHKGLPQPWYDSQYELYDFGKLFFKDNRKALYLKMNSQTQLGLIHVEGVSNDCETVIDAIQFRLGLTKDDMKELITVSIK